MRLLITLLLLIFCLNVSAQIESLPNKQLGLSIGKSTHGSGDLSGFIFTTGYSKYFSKNFSFNIELSGTIHSKEDTLFLRPSPTLIINSSIRSTRAGGQITGHTGYSFLRNVNHSMKIAFGPLIRYQSSSNFGYTILYPIATGFPTPLLYFQNLGPQNIFTVGASLQLKYEYNVSNKIALGLLGGYQIDSEGDNISQISLSIGRRF